MRWAVAALLPGWLAAATGCATRRTAIRPREGSAAAPESAPAPAHPIGVMLADPPLPDEPADWTLWPGLAAKAPPGEGAEPPAEGDGAGGGHHGH